MSTTPEEFDKLQKLLKLKRYEQPPPGYFNSFPTRVINRLERETEQGKRWGDASLFLRLLAMLETNPIAAGLFGMSVCGLLISGIAYSQSRPPSTYSDNSNLTIDVADVTAASMQMPESSRVASVDSLAPSASPIFGTNASSTFDGMKLPAAERVSFQLNQ
jgi:hypothetical protein